jgi:DNA-binding MarR family transcriptional regulator
MSKIDPVPYTMTLHVRDHCLCLHTQRAARMLGRRFDAALRPFGLTNGQFSLLMSLNRPEPPAMAPVAALLAMDRTTLTAALKPLQLRGLIAMGVHAGDRRKKRLSLTDEGHAVLARALPVWERTHFAVEAALGANLEALRTGLATLATDYYS